MNYSNPTTYECVQLWCDRIDGRQLDQEEGLAAGELREEEQVLTGDDRPDLANANIYLTILSRIKT